MKILGYSSLKKEQGGCYWEISHGMTAAQSQYWDPHSADDGQQRSHALFPINFQGG